MIIRMLADGVAVPPARSNPPAHPARKSYAVQPGDTVESIASQHHVTPQALASANGIAHYAGSPWANGYRTDYQSLAAGMVLQLPPPNIAPASSDAPQTPQAKTDAAAKAYQQAVKDRADAMAHAPQNMSIRYEVSQAQDAAVAKARTAFDSAVQAEINAKVADANTGVPGQFRTPETQLVKSYGAQIAQRYTADATLHGDVQNVTHALQVKRAAGDLIAGASTADTAAAKLQQIDLKGQPQEVVDAVLADSRVQQWIKQAAADVDKPYDGVSNYATAEQQAPDAAKRLMDTVKGLSPQLAAAVVQQSMPTIDKIAQCEMIYGGRNAYNSMQQVAASLGSSPQAQALTQRIARDYVPQAEKWEGFSSESTRNFVVGGGNPALAIALAGELRSDGKGQQADGVLNVVAIGIHDCLAYAENNPLKAYDAAHKAAEGKNQRLAELLAKAGALSDDQKQAFIKAYMKDPANAKVYRADADAAKALGEYMNANKSALLFAAGRDPEVAQQLYSCMKDLAQSGQGKVALEFADAVKNDPAAAQAFAGFSDYQSDFLPKAMASAQGQLLIEANGDAATAADRLMELAEPLFKGKEGWAAAKESYEKLAQGDTGALSAEAMGKSFAKLGPAGRGLAMASIMVSAYNGYNAKDISTMVAAYATAGGNAAGLATGAVQYLVDAGKFGRYTEGAAAVARFGAKFVPGLAVIASTAAFASDVSKAADGNPAYALALFGDVVSFIGGVLETTGFGEMPGAFLTGAGALVSAPFEFIGSLIEGNKEMRELQEETEKYLGQIDMDEATSKALAESDPDQMKQLLATGMTPAQIQELGKDDPQLLQSEHSYGPYVGDWPKLLERTGMSGTDLFNMLKAADEGGQPGAGIYELSYVLGHANFFPQVAGARSKAELISALKGVETQLGSASASKDQVRAVHQAVQWLQSH